MPTPYPAVKDWSSYLQISMEEFVERYPKVMEDILIEDLEEFMEDHADDTIYVIPGDVTLTEADTAKLSEDYDKIVVEGCLRAAVNPTNLLYVKGDLYCDFMSLDESLLVVDGQAFAKYYVSLNAEDDCHMRSAPTLRVDTPLLFSWFYKIDRLTLSPETIIFILGTDYCKKLVLPNIIFPWHDAVYVLKPEVTEYVGDHYHDYASWDLEIIADALKNGESIFIDGFNVKAMEYQASARMLIAAKDYRSAYLTYKKAAGLFPGYYQGWFGMAIALQEAGAFAQAVPICQEAVKRFPTDQTGLVNYAADHGAWMAIRTQQPETALTFATHSLEHNKSEDQESRSTAYRFRAEALYRLNRIQEATDDVDAALALKKDYSTANWLKGLLLHRTGKSIEAKKYHQLAAEGYERFSSASYDEEDGTEFLDDKPITVDWDNVDIANYEPPGKDEAFWHTYFSENDAMEIKRVPPALLTNALCMVIVAREATEKLSNGNIPAAAYFPKTVFTRELAVALVTLNLRNLQYVPIMFVDKTLFMLGPIKDYNVFDFNIVPEEIVDADICLHAVRCGATLESLPPAWINKEICFASVEYHSYSLEHVPAALLTDELYFAAMINGNKYFFKSRLPNRYKTPEMLARAIAHDKRALHSIPGNLFDAKLLVLAEQLYGDDEDWTEILAQHGCATADKSGCLGAAAEICWSVFWDEAFMLRHIKKESRRLSPYEIPENCYSQGIAEACFENQPIHLDSIPSKWITSEMCASFIEKYPDMLDHIPVAMRTEAICTPAVKKKSETLSLVPLAMRTVALCVIALEQDGGDGDLDKYIPPDIAVAVFDILITRHSKDSNLDKLYVQRGDAKLNQVIRDIAGALDDYRNVAAKKDHESVVQDSIEEALYSIGYCHHLRGEMVEAEIWRAKLADEAAWPPYADLSFSRPAEVVDFSKRQFDALIQEYVDAMKIDNYQAGYEIILAAEQMLTKTGTSNPVLWAVVFGGKHDATYELDMWDEHIDCCRAAVDRLGKLNLWAYLSSDDIIRLTLRKAYERLGTWPLQDDAPSLEALSDGLALVNKAMTLRGGGEKESCLYSLYDGRAALLLALAEMDESYTPAAMRALDTIHEKKLMDKGLITTESVVDALEIRLAENNFST